MHQWATELFPITRSITGEGVRETLSYLQSKITDLTIHSVSSGTQALDWTVPQEWVIRDAYIADENGQRIVDFKKNNLHLVGYSTAIDCWLTKEELDNHLYSLPEQPNAIPYVTAYYKKHWGFCLKHVQREQLKQGNYHVVIDSEHIDGVLNYGELLIPGKTSDEILLSTYICHPSMANNELSGPVVTTALAQWISQLENRHYSYRIIYIPETIGSIVYLSKHLDHMKSHTYAGFNINCIGDERCYSYLPSRKENTISDIIAKHVLEHTDPEYKHYSWLDRGSDERQYCAPNIDLPIASIMRSKFGEYPEYHTSLDDLNLVTPNGLEGGLDAMKSCINILENNVIPTSTVLGEPQLGKRNLYPNVGVKGGKDAIPDLKTMIHIISYCDGEKSLLEIADKINQPFEKCRKILNTLIENNLVSIKSV